MEIYDNLSAVDLAADLSEEKKLRAELEKKDDADSKRLSRFLALTDLTRAAGHPIRELAERIFAIPELKNFDHIQVPEIVKADLSFDLFDFPPEHPARSKSDTYYLTDPEGVASRPYGASNYILRTHTTIMWYYYLIDENIKERIKKGLPVGSLCHGKVYRKDEIDRNHMNVFHQMDGWYLCKKSDRVITSQDLQDVLVKIAKAVFGENVKYRFNADRFPYTDPSLEMEVEINDRWLEVLGSGVVKGSVLKNLGVDPDVYNGWAFGFGLERLAIISMELPDIRLLWSEDERVKKQLKLGNKFQEVSKFPPITRDISFIVDKKFVPNDYFDLIRDIGGNLVEEVKLLDSYADEKKFGKEQTS